MNILGYTGSRRSQFDQSRRRLWLLKEAKAQRTLLKRFMHLSGDDGEIPMRFFPMRGLGHDSSAALVRDGKTVAAAAEERFTRRKHAISLDGRVSMPRNAVRYCLNESACGISTVDYVAYYLNMSEEVFGLRQKMLGGVLPVSVRDGALREARRAYEDEFCRTRVEASLRELVDDETVAKKLVCVPHHLAHASAAYYGSGFSHAAVLTLDGYGEYESSIVAIGDDHKLLPVESTTIPDSLGIIYMMITVLLGFEPLGDEYKVMGLAAYGNPEHYRSVFEKLILIDKQGAYRTPALVREEFPEELEELLGKARDPVEAISPRHADIAAALQRRVEEAVFAQLEHIKSAYGCESLCLSGGVALNSALNGKIVRSGLFKDVFAFPAAADDGCAVGAAQYVYHQVLGNPLMGKPLADVYLGPCYTDEECAEAVHKAGGQVRVAQVDDLERAVSDRLQAKKVVAWFQGRMEFGPRALGSRSILADPRDAAMKDIVNERVKWREMFRPFAPVVPEERAAEFFDMKGLPTSPYMLFVVPVLPEQEAQMPATTHHDHTARVQTVSRARNPGLWRLLSVFGQATGLPVLLNTSFNVKGEPIVCCPEDALRCFLKTNIDCLVLNNLLVEKVD